MWVVGSENEGSQNKGSCPAMWEVGSKNVGSGPAMQEVVSENEGSQNVGSFPTMEEGAAASRELSYLPLLTHLEMGLEMVGKVNNQNSDYASSHCLQ